MLTSTTLREIHRQRQEEQDFRRPVRGIVRSVQTETETVKVESFQRYGSQTLGIRHPFVGKSSWLRCMPETGTSVITQHIAEPDQLEVWGYMSRRLGGLLQQSRKNEDIIFRQLRPGEMEAMSVGRAYTHWSEDGNITLLGGVVEQHLSQVELEATTRSPTHKRQLDQHNPTALGYEERFGVVKRPDFLKPASTQVYVKDLTTFQYEYGRWLKDDTGNLLTTLHEGNLYDQTQVPIVNTTTGGKVRLRRLVGHRLSGSLAVDVDEDLNISLTNAATAKTVDLNFGAVSEMKVTSRQFDLNILQASNQSFTQSLTVRSPNIAFQSTATTFGFAPVQPAVLGTTLTAAVLTPFILQMQTAVTLLAADDGLKDKPTRDGLKAISQALNGIAGAVASVLSTEVVLTR